MSELGVQAALHHDAGAAQLDGLLDLAKDLLVAEQITLGRAQRPVEGAEIAAGGAEVGVIDVAVDDEGDIVAWQHPAAHGVRGRAHRDQLAALQQRQRLMPR